MKKIIYIFLSLLFFENLTFSHENLDLGEITTYIQDESSSSTTFNKEDIEKTSAKNLAEFLEKQGFLMMNTGGIGSMSNLSFGGYAGFCIKVYVDGVLANNPTSGEFDWNQVDINSIESISINYTPVFSNYEFAGISISIITKKFSSESGEIWTQSTSYANSLFDSNFVKVNYRSNIGLINYKLDFALQDAANCYELPNATSNSGNENRLGSGGISLDTFLGDFAINFDTRITYNQYACNLNSFIDGIGLEKSFNNRESLLLKYKNHHFRLTHQGISSKYNSSNNNIQTIDADYSISLDKENINIFTKFRSELSNSFHAHRFSLSAGSTKEFKIKNFMKITPSLSCLAYKNKNSDINLEALPSISFNLPYGLNYSVYRAFILPTFNQLYWQGAGFVPNPNLKAESGWGHTLTFNKKDFPIFAIIQNSWYTNKITWTGKSSQGTFAQNSKNGLFLSATLGSNYKWEKWGYKCSFTYNKAVIEKWSGPQIMWVPKFQGCAEVFTNFGIFDFKINFSFVGKRPKSNENFSYYDAYYLLSASILMHISNKMEFAIIGNNLLDYRYYYHDNFSAPSRSINFNARIFF